jgi:hypothetical protein
MRRLSTVIACTLGSDDLRAQAGRWRRLQREAGLGISEADDGVRLRFRDEQAVDEELRALVAVETDCCAWARWEISREADELVLDVSSTPAGATVLQSMFSRPE